MNTWKGNRRASMLQRVRPTCPPALDQTQGGLQARPASASLAQLAKRGRTSLVPHLDGHHRLLGRLAGGGRSEVVDGEERVQGRLLVGHEVQRVAEHVGLHAPRRMVHLIVSK
jgi:hypothetical protein